MAEQVEGDVAESDILFELRSVGYPRPELLREDQRVIPQPQCVLGDIGGRGATISAGELGRELDLVDGDIAVHVGLVGNAHRCGTPSDAV